MNLSVIEYPSVSFLLLTKLHFFVDKWTVKLHLFLTFIFSFISLKSIACHLSPYEKIGLLYGNSYKEETECSNDFYIFKDREGDLSREESIDLIKSLAREANLFFDDFTISEKGSYLWNISNNRFLKEERNLASISQQELTKPKTNNLSFGVFSEAASISSTDTSSGVTEDAAANLGYGAYVLWSRKWSERGSYFVVGSLKSYSFDVGSGRTLVDSNVTQGYVGAGLSMKLGSRVSMGVGLGLGESLILTSGGNSNLEIEKVTIPAASVSK